jgi:palmitoyl-protein thioesterase
MIFMRILVIVALLTLAASVDPVVLFHGMGDQCKNTGMNGFTELIGKELNTYSVCIEVGNGAMTSLFHNITDQAVQACGKLSQDPRLQTNISVVGLSQGSLIGRWVIQNCPTFKGTVRRYISIGGPQMGVARIPGCFHGKFCDVKPT